MPCRVRTSQYLTANSEKNDMIGEANHLITTIKQMAASLDDDTYSARRASDDPSLRVTLPLNSCLAQLREKHATVSKLHRERFEQVKSKRTSQKALSVNAWLTAYQNSWKL